MDNLTIALIIAIVILTICIIGAVIFYVSRGAKNGYVYSFESEDKSIIFPSRPGFVTFVTPNIKIGEMSILSLWLPGAPMHKMTANDIDVPTTPSVDLAHVTPLESTIVTPNAFMFAKRIAHNEWSIGFVGATDVDHIDMSKIIWLANQKPTSSDIADARIFRLQRHIVMNGESAPRNVSDK